MWQESGPLPRGNTELHANTVGRTEWTVCVLANDGSKNKRKNKKKNGKNGVCSLTLFLTVWEQKIYIVEHTLGWLH